MNNIIPSNLINQIVEISDLNALSKFFIIHLESLIFLTCFYLFVLMFALAITFEFETKVKINKKISGYIIFPSIFLTILCCVFVSRYNDFRQTELNESQFNLIQSIQSPIFQEFVGKSIKTNGKTILAIETAVKKYNNSNMEKRFKDVNEFIATMEFVQNIPN